MRTLILIFLILYSSSFCQCQLPGNDKNWNTYTSFFEDFTGTNRYWNDDRTDNTQRWIAYFSECGVTHDSTVNCVHYYEHQIYQRENAIFSTNSPGYMILKAETNQILLIIGILLPTRLHVLTIIFPGQ